MNGKPSTRPPKQPSACPVPLLLRIYSSTIFHVILGMFLSSVSQPRQECKRGRKITFWVVRLGKPTKPNHVAETGSPLSLLHAFAVQGTLWRWDGEWPRRFSSNEVGSGAERCNTIRQRHKGPTGAAEGGEAARARMTTYCTYLGKHARQHARPEPCAPLGPKRAQAFVRLSHCGVHVGPSNALVLFLSLSRSHRPLPPSLLVLL